VQADLEAVAVGRQQLAALLVQAATEVEVEAAALPQRLAALLVQAATEQAAAALAGMQMP
jgi:hypothetical protein